MLKDLKFKIFYILLFAFYVISCFNRYLVNDDYMALHNGWLKFNGLVSGRDFNVDSYSLLIDMFTPFSPILPLHFGGVLVFRILLVATLILCVALLYKITKRLMGEMAAWISPFVTLCSAPVFIRSLDIRPDLFIITLYLLCFEVMTRDDFFEKRKNIFLAGVYISLSFLFKFKAIIILGPLALYLIALVALKEIYLNKAFEVITTVFLGFCLTSLVYLFYIYLFDDIETFISVNKRLIGGVATNKVQNSSAVFTTFAHALKVTKFVFGVVVLGIVTRLCDWKSWKLSTNLLYVTILLTALLGVVVNPAYFGYNLVILIPLVGISSGHFFSYLWRHINKAGFQSDGVIIFTLALIFAVNLNTLLSTTFIDKISYQKALNKFLIENVHKDNTVFAFEGIGAYNRSNYHWRISSTMVPYYHANYRLKDEFENSNLEIIITNYRVPRWLTKEDKEYISKRFVILAPYVFVPGVELKESRKKVELPLSIPGKYEVLNSQGRSCLVDGVSYKSGSIINLLKGNYVLEHEQKQSGHCLLRKFYSKKNVRELLLSNKSKHEYLKSPYFD